MDGVYRAVAWQRVDQIRYFMFADGSQAKLNQFIKWSSRPPFFGISWMRIISIRDEQIRSIEVKRE
jgi:hypothetical protein